MRNIFISLLFFLLMNSLAFASYIPKHGYTVLAECSSLNPADSTTYYCGSIWRLAATTTADTSRLYIPKAGTITSAYMTNYTTTVLSTAEASTVSIRLNNTTDTQLSNAVTFDSIVTSFSNTALSIAVVAGDYIEIKWATPAWVTNPTGVKNNIVVYIEY